MGQRLAAAVALAAIVLAPQAFSLDLLSFLHAKELIYAIATLLLLALACFRGQGAPAPRLLWALLAWLVLALLFSGAEPRMALEKFARAALVIAFAAGALFALPDAPGRHKIRVALVASAGLAATLGLLQYLHVMDAWLPVFPGYDQRMYSVFGNQDLLGGYIALALPLALGMALAPASRARTLAWLLLPFLLAALLLSESRSAWLAAALGGALAAGNAWRGSDDRKAATRQIVLLGGALLVTGLAAAPLWAPRVLESFSAADTGGRLRLWFWAGTLHMLHSAPLLGVGFGGYGYHSPFHLGAVLRGPGGENYARNELFTDHAHCDPLEILAETGLLGGLGLAALLAWALRGHLAHLKGAVPVLTAFAVFAALNPALASAPHAIFALLSAVPIAARLDSPRNAWPWLPAALFCAAIWLWHTFLPSTMLVRAENRWIRGAATEETVRELAYIVERFGGPPAAGEDLIEAMTEYTPPFPLAERYLDRALETTDTGRAHLLAGRLLHSADPRRALAAYMACLARWPDNAEARAGRDALLKQIDPNNATGSSSP